MIRDVPAEKHAKYMNDYKSGTPRDASTSNCPKIQRLCIKIAGVLLIVGGIQFMLGVVLGDSQYLGYNSSIRWRSQQ